MDPPELRTSTIPANPLGLRPESGLMIRSVKIWAGPSRRPSGINALTFGRAKITLTLARDLEQSRPRARREAPPGRADRAGDIPNSKRMRSVFPSEPPGAEL